MEGNGGQRGDKGRYREHTYIVRAVEVAVGRHVGGHLVEVDVRIEGDAHRVASAEEER